MKPKEKAIQLFNRMYKYQLNKKDPNSWLLAVECSVICVEEIILSNPHGNPLNSNAESTMEYWQEVKQEIQAL